MIQCLRQIRNAALLVLVSGIAVPSLAQLPVGFDRYVDSVLSVFEVPGMSVAVVKNNTIVLAKGYGYRTKGEPVRTDEHTLFPIASNTKAFTALALAILVEEGALRWDDKVIQYLPWFRMSDAWVTSELTIRDLLVHHTGIPAYAGDVLLFPPSTYSRREILERLRVIPLVKSFRTTYAYDNILYVAAGEIVKEVSHQDFEAFVQNRIFAAAGMSESIARFTALKNYTNRATGHQRLQGTVTAVNEYLEQSIGDAGNPAGGIVSNATDMARWLLVQLDSGHIGSNKIVSTAGFRELWKVVTPVPITKVPRGLELAQPDFMGYALGMRTSNYGRHVVVSHGGKLDGFVSQVVLLPKENIGIAILTNQESTGAYWSVIYKLLDYYLQNPSYNWVAPYVRLMQDSKTEWENEWNKTRIVPAKSTPKPVDLEKYVGVYKDDFYGNITVEKVASGLVFHFHQTPQFTGQLSPLQYDTFTALFRNKNLKADSWMSFSRSPEGTISGLTLKVIDPSSDISFEGLSFKKVKSP